MTSTTATRTVVTPARIVRVVMPGHAIDASGGRTPHSILDQLKEATNAA